MNATIINNWNSLVQPDDIVWHLGDVCFCSTEKITSILRRLNGKKYMIWGNHDKPIKDSAANCFENIHTYAELNVQYQSKAYNLVLLHYPIEQWVGSHKGYTHLHGHSHGTVPARGKRIDVGVDGHGHHQQLKYQPLSFRHILKVSEDLEELK